MAFKVSGRELIDAYAPYINKTCKESVLIRPDREYRVWYDDGQLTIESPWLKRNRTYEILYRIGPSPVGEDFPHYEVDAIDFSMHPETFLPLYGYYTVDDLSEIAFDDLVRENGYTIMCRDITADGFPTMYRDLLSRQARRETIPSLKGAYLTFPYSAMSYVPPELQHHIARYIEAISSPSRQGIPRIVRETYVPGK
jgi:hypothetical protein